jgi:hypothetical protein
VGDHIGRLELLEVFVVHAGDEIAHHIRRKIRGRCQETVQDGVASNGRLFHAGSIAKVHAEV